MEFVPRTFWWAQSSDARRSSTKAILIFQKMEVVRGMITSPALVTAALVCSQCPNRREWVNWTGYWWLSIVLAYCVGAFANHVV